MTAHYTTRRTTLNMILFFPPSASSCIGFPAAFITSTRKLVHLTFASTLSASRCRDEYPVLAINTKDLLSLLSATLGERGIAGDGRLFELKSMLLPPEACALAFVGLVNP